MMHVPPQALWALDRLALSGFDAWLAGGCVRDALMGLPPHDYDIVTSASPEEMMQVFAQERLIATGLKHGTVTVLKDGMPLEITSLRASSIHDDLRLRDLTINAMAWRPSDGLLDPCGGRQDLQSCLLRAPVDPQARFSEDPLRILRALRFAAATSFTIEETTLQAMERLKARLCDVSAERIYAEILRLLCASHVRQVLTQHLSILAAVVPEALPMQGFDQHNRHHIYDVLSHTAVSVESIAAQPVLRLAMFFHDIGKPSCFHTGEDGQGHFYGHASISASIAQTVLQRWKADTFTRERVVELVRLHDRQIEPTHASVRRALNRLTPEVFDQLLLIKRADNLAQAPQYRSRQQNYDQLERIRDEILSAHECFSLRDLALNGRDLLALGFPPGPAIGRTLTFLLDSVIAGEVENTREALVRLIEDQRL